MQMINRFGVMVDVSPSEWESVRKHRPHEVKNFITRPDLGVEGAGPHEKVLYLLHVNGIGDMVHAMPALRSQIESGKEVWVACQAEHAPYFKRLGCNISDEGDRLDSIQRLHAEFGRIHILKHWCITHDQMTGGDVSIPRFAQFAEYVGATLPAEFDWTPYLLPDTKNIRTCDVVLGLDSTSGHRGYPHHQKLFDELTAKHLTVRAFGLPGGAAEYAEVLTMDGLIRAVAGAKVVIAVDAGILALALALRKPTIALMGPTSEKIIIDQFNRYYPVEVQVIRSTLTDNRCSRPCNLQNARGWQVAGKCHSTADCMKEIQVSTVLNALEELWQKKQSLLPLNLAQSRRRNTTQPNSTSAASTRSASGRKKTLPKPSPATTSSPLPSEKETASA